LYAQFMGKMERLAKWRAEAFELRLKGLDYREIGARLDVTTTAAERLVKEQLGAIQPTREQLTEVMTLELGRLDYMTSRLMKRIEGDSRDDAAYNLLLKISERRAKLIGLDAPKKAFSAVAIITDLPNDELNERAKRIFAENKGDFTRTRSTVHQNGVP